MTTSTSIWTNLFKNAVDFNQNLGDLNISEVSDMSGMLDNTGLSVSNYSNTLIGWASQNNIPYGITLGAEGLFYNIEGMVARNTLITIYGWTFVGDTYQPSPACFNENTNILTWNLSTQTEQYIPIQFLKVGDWVKTFQEGYQRILGINHKTMNHHPDNAWYDCMFQMKKTIFMQDDLFLTGQHAILVNSLPKDILSQYKELNIIPTKINKFPLLICAFSTLFEKVPYGQTFTYYHFTLEANGDKFKQYAVWANGILCETMSAKQFNISMNQPNSTYSFLQKQQNKLANLCIY